MATTNAKHPQDAMNQGAERSKDAASSLGEKAKDAASAAMDKTRDAASNMADKAKDAGKRAGDMAADAANRLGEGMESLGKTVREKGPQGGVMGTASSRVAETLVGAGRYLGQEGFSGMANDLSDVIKRNPLPAVLIGIGLGFWIGMGMGRRS